MQISPRRPRRVPYRRAVALCTAALTALAGAAVLKSPGRLTIPGLSVISHAADFHGELDLTDGVLHESGGGMTLTAWVATGKDELVVDVTGADPSVPQTASISLWSPREPAAAVSGTVGTLAESWTDQAPPIGTGDATPALTGAAEPGARVAVTADGTALCTAAVAADGSRTCTAGEPLAAGPHILRARATDPTGTPAAPVAVAVTVT